MLCWKLCAHRFWLVRVHLTLIWPVPIQVVVKLMADRWSDRAALSKEGAAMEVVCRTRSHGRRVGKHQKGEQGKPRPIHSAWRVEEACKCLWHCSQYSILPWPMSVPCLHKKSDTGRACEVSSGSRWISRTCRSSLARMHGVAYACQCPGPGRFQTCKRSRCTWHLDF